jgi:hypothetical protein
MGRKDGSTLRGAEKGAQKRAGASVRSSRYREFIERVFATYYGMNPPWLCFFCGEEIVKLGQDPDSLNRHHVDGDWQNNTRTNLVPSHLRCHTSHHAVLRLEDFTKESRERAKIRKRDSGGRFIHGT